MSDAYEARKRLTENVLGDAGWAVDQIVELRAEVERLTAENAAFRSQFADVAEVEALLQEHDGDLTKAGWVKSDYASERALADQLAEALRAAKTDRPTAHSDDVWTQILAALAAWEAARQ